MTSALEHNAADRKKLAARITSLKKQAETAKRVAKSAKTAVKVAKQKFKEAKRAAKKLRKAAKELEIELSLLSVKKIPRKSPVRRLSTKRTVTAAQSAANTAPPATSESASAETATQ